MTLVENFEGDSNGVAERVLIHHHFPRKCFLESGAADNLLPRGSDIWIKQPCLTLRLGRETMIRVDHPTDYIIHRGTMIFHHLQDEDDEAYHDRMLQEVCKLSDVLESEWVEANLVAAERIAAQQIDQIEQVPSAVACQARCHSNRAKVAISLGWTYGAWMNHKTIQEIFPHSSTWAVLTAELLYLSGCYDRALATIYQAFATYVSFDPETMCSKKLGIIKPPGTLTRIMPDEDIKLDLRELKDIRERLLHKTTLHQDGEYNFEGIWKTLISMESRFYSFGAFPTIIHSIAWTVDDLGKSVPEAAKDICAGELVLAEKAAAFSWEVEVPSILALIESGPISTTHFHVWSSLVQSMLHSRDIAFIMLPCSPPGPLLDVDEYGRVIFNVFAPRDLILARWLRMICETDVIVNGIGCISYDGGYGFWPIAASVDDSCTRNLYWTCFGNVGVLRATRPIAKGERLYLNFRNDQCSIEKRTKPIHETEYRCFCKWCETQSQVPEDVMVDTYQHLQQFDELMSEPMVTDRERKSVLRKARNIYSRICGNRHGQIVQPEILEILSFIVDLASDLPNGDRPSSDELVVGLEVGTGADLSGLRKFEPLIPHPTATILLAKLVNALKQEAQEAKDSRSKKQYRRGKAVFRTWLRTVSGMGEHLDALINYEEVAERMCVEGL